MTYGQAAQDLRDALADVLQHRRPETVIRDTRVQRHRGQLPVLHPRQELIDLVVRLRAPVWRMVAALAHDVAGQMHLSNALRPAAELSAHLAPVLPPRETRPSTRELAHTHPVPVIDAWRRAAVAAITLTERELPAVGDDLPVPHRLVMLRDAAQITSALLRLDGRYTTLPGWQTLHDLHDAPAIEKLVATAETARTWPYGPRYTEAEGYVIDQLGHPPNPPRRPLPPSPVATAIDELRRSNTMLTDRLPPTRTLRYIAAGHRAITDHLRQVTWDSGQHVAAEDLMIRSGHYSRIFAELDGVRSGVDAAEADTDTAAREHLLRAHQALRGVEQVTPRELAELTQVMHETDNMISTIILTGVRTRWFLEQTGQISWHNAGAIKRAHTRWGPVSATTHPGLERSARELAWDTPALSADPYSARHRAWFATVLEHTDTNPAPDAPDLDTEHPRALRRHFARMLHDPAYAEENGGLIPTPHSEWPEPPHTGSGDATSPEPAITGLGAPAPPALPGPCDTSCAALTSAPSPRDMAV